MCRSMSRPKNLHNVHRLVKVTECEKVVFPSKPVASFYVNPQMNIHSPGSLWKTPVDNAVDNVENYELSTGIPLLFRIVRTPFTSAYGSAYSGNSHQGSGVTSLVFKTSVSGKPDEKVGSGQKKGCQKTPGDFFHKKYLLKTEKTGVCIIFLPLEILCL